MLPVNDLKRGYDIYKTQYEKKVVEVLRSGWYILGKEVTEFEKSFALSLEEHCYCAGVDNGLNAIILGLRVLGIGKGDEVLVQSNAYMATVIAIIANGATPVFVEPDEYYNMNPDLVENKITPKTKAVMLTHLYGQASRMDKFVTLCKDNEIYLLEDCAQAHFSTFNHKSVGLFGEMGFFSFYPTKNLGGFGDGGAVVSCNQKLIDKIKTFRNYGSREKYIFEEIGINSRLDELQAGLLQVKLSHKEEITKARETIALEYLEKIKNDKVILPKIAQGASHVWHLFVVRVEDRDNFRSYLSSCGIGSDIHYPIPPHLSPALSYMNFQKDDFPISEKYADSVVSLPIFQGMTPDEINLVIDTVNNYE